MPPQATLAKMFKAAGYATAHIGKWHLGFTPETMPNGQGFDYSFGHMGGCIDNFSHFFYWEGPNRHDLYRNGQEVYYPGRFFPDLMVEEARRFLKENRQRPFFLYFAFNMPHYPYQAEPKWLEHYKGLPYPRNLYAAFVSTLDDRVGALLKTVDELGPAPADDHRLPVRQRPLDRRSAPTAAAAARARIAAQVQPLRGGHPPAGNDLLAGTFARRRRARTGAPMPATGCPRWPNSAG